MGGQDGAFRGEKRRLDGAGAIGPRPILGLEYIGGIAREMPVFERGGDIRLDDERTPRRIDQVAARFHALEEGRVRHPDGVNRQVEAQNQKIGLGDEIVQRRVLGVQFAFARLAHRRFVEVEPAAPKAPQKG